MRSNQILELTEGTADAAFAVERSGRISAWNPAAAELFGLTAAQAIGQPCHEILQGKADEGSNLFCSSYCTVQQALEQSATLPNFDLQVQTVDGRKWCNVTIMMARDRATGLVQAIHIIHPGEIGKRMELLLHDFTTHLVDQRTATTVASIALTPREIQILRLMASGASTNSIAEDLSISPETVRNHIKHVLNKLGAHNRLDAVRRAEKAAVI